MLNQPPTPPHIQTTMRDILRFLKLIRRHWGVLSKATLSGILLTLLSMPVPYLTRVLVDRVLPTRNQELLYLILILIFLITVLGAFGRLLRNCFTTRIGIGMGLDLKFKFYHHLQSLSFAFFDRRQTGELLARFEDIDASLANTVGLLDKMVMSGLSLLIFPPILLHLDGRLALLSLAVLPVDAYVFIRMAERIARTSRSLTEKNTEVSARSYESLSGIRTVQATGIEKRTFDRLKHLLLGLRHLSLKRTRLQETSVFIAILLGATAQLLYGWYGWTRILDGHLTLGNYLAFMMYVGYLYAPVKQIVGLSGDLQIAGVHLCRFFEIYDIIPGIQDVPGAQELPPVRGEIRFHRVTFGYNGTDPILRDLDVTIRPGELTALIGSSGVGKTTFAHLIPRFYDPHSGDIHIDGHRIRQVRLNSLRRQIAFVQQEPFLFSGTILENITLAKPSATQEEMERAVLCAHAQTFIQKLENGYDTQVGERGVQLSQGQKQRIALARVLLQEAPILILDEATSAVDEETELRIYDALRERRRGKTTLLIAHRPSTIRYADRTLMLDAARIAERGTHMKPAMGSL